MFVFLFLCFFFFNDTATTEIYTLSLHDALPIPSVPTTCGWSPPGHPAEPGRSEEHTSELQSHVNLVCRLLLEKKKKNNKNIVSDTNLKHHNIINNHTDLR